MTGQKEKEKKEKEKKGGGGEEKEEGEEAKLLRTGRRDNIEGTTGGPPGPKK